MDNADSKLERSDEPIRHTFREQTAQQQFHQQLVYTNYLTRSAAILYQSFFLSSIVSSPTIVFSF